MLLTAMLLSASLVATEPSAVAPAQQQETAPQPEAAAATPDAGGSAQAAIDAGLKAFARRRYAKATEEFERAVAADPQSAAAHFYLGYVHYKRGEPTLRMDEHKQKANAEFAKAYELDPAFRPVWAATKK